jgi:hypothetical protein
MSAGTWRGLREEQTTGHHENAALQDLTPYLLFFLVVLLEIRPPKTNGVTIQNTEK